jgi:hypothetical protein
VSTVNVNIQPNIHPCDDEPRADINICGMDLITDQPTLWAFVGAMHNAITAFYYRQVQAQEAARGVDYSRIVEGDDHAEPARTELD